MSLDSWSKRLAHPVIKDATDFEAVREKTDVAGSLKGLERRSRYCVREITLASRRDNHVFCPSHDERGNSNGMQVR